MEEPFKIWLCSNQNVNDDKPIPKELSSQLYAVVKAQDSSWSTDVRARYYYSLLYGLATSSDNDTERGRYTVAVANPLRINLVEDSVGKASLTERGEFMWIRDGEVNDFKKGKFNAGEMHEVATRLVVSLSNPAWTFALDPKSPWGVALVRAGGDCMYSIWLENPVSLRKLSVIEAKALTFQIRMRGIFGWPREAMRTLGWS